MKGTFLCAQLARNLKSTLMKGLTDVNMATKKRRAGDARRIVTSL
jgi:hypothetical protein